MEFRSKAKKSLRKVRNFPFFYPREKFASELVKKISVVSGNLLRSEINGWKIQK